MRRKSTEVPVLVDIAGIAAMLRVSYRTARRLVREQDFPPRVKLRGCHRWWKVDVLRHVREKSDPQRFRDPDSTNQPSK